MRRLLSLLPMSALAITLGCNMREPNPAGDGNARDARAADAKAVKEDLAALEGYWKCERYFVDGKPSKDVMPSEFSFLFKDNRMIVARNGELYFVPKIKLEPTESPKRFLAEEIYNWSCIYEIKGEILRLDVGSPNKFPASFGKDAFAEYTLKKAGKVDDPASPVIGTSKPLVAADVVQEFHHDVEKAKAAYEGKILIISGKVASLILGKRDSSAEVVLTGKAKGDVTENIKCTCGGGWAFGGHIDAGLKRIKTGDQLVLAGTFDGYRNSAVNMRFCRLLD